MTTTIANPRRSIEQCIRALPQELQDNILDFTLAIETHTAITITKNYKPPLCLQLNRKIRQEYEKPYYFDATITSGNPELLRNFVISLETRNRSKLYQIRLSGSRNTGHASYVATKLCWSLPLDISKDVPYDCVLACAGIDDWFPAWPEYWGEE